VNIFDAYSQNLLIELNKNNVQYLIVGGYAVNYYGYRRTTGDLDLLIKPDNGLNKDNLIKSFKNLGVSTTALNRLNKLDFTKPLIFIDGEEPFKIDFMTKISGVDFTDAWEKRVPVEIDGIKVNFINLNDLLISKISSNRLQDKLDVEKLQEIQRIKKNKK
jgi:predicted nucleotidyltransferase